MFVRLFELSSTALHLIPSVSAPFLRPSPLTADRRSFHIVVSFPVCPYLTTVGSPLYLMCGGGTQVQSTLSRSNRRRVPSLARSIDEGCLLLSCSSKQKSTSVPSPADCFGSFSFITSTTTTTEAAAAAATEIALKFKFNLHCTCLILPSIKCCEILLFVFISFPLFFLSFLPSFLPS